MKTFLLQFEEMARCSISPSDTLDRGSGNSEVVAGTKTLTEVRREGVDDDPQTHSSVIIPKRPNFESPESRTGTITFVRAEQADADPKHESLSVFPK